MHRKAVLSCLLALLVAPSASVADARFDAAAAKAERLDDLRKFLGQFVGSCTDPFERRTCEANVAAFRKGASGKTFVVRVTEASQVVRTQSRGGSVVVLLTPFIDGGGYALTRGQPKRQDADGNPLVDLVPMEVPLPPGMMEMDFLRPFRSGSIDVEVVFRPDATWKMKRKGEPGSYEGLAARFVALRVINSRDDSEIAAKIW
ncbi:MAG TPA: DUF6066 family protein [Anaeromyxobacteraceae bacterium]|nr:DUF6066 family protein [Anaeromyxobacteraceae bacterium]